MDAAFGLFADSYCGRMAEPSVLTASGKADAASRKAAWQKFDNTGNVPLHVPGIVLPVDFELKDEERFRHGVNDFSQDRLVVREIAMLAVMNAITEKPEWRRKVFDDKIVEKWRVEAMGMRFMSAAAWEWSLKELREKAAFVEEHGFVTTLDTGSVCAKGDGLVDEGVRQELIARVQPLLNVEDNAQDWHPNSNDQVLNLVHPSMFPLVYGRTQVLQAGRVGLDDCLDYCGKGEIAPEQTIAPKNKAQFSTRFQWLPAEVNFKGPDGTDVCFDSYINNLHPGHYKGLYSTIEKIASRAIPMWNKVLVNWYRGNIPPRIKVWEVDAGSPEPPEDLMDVYELDDDEEDENYPAALAKVLDYLALPDHPSYDASKDNEDDEVYKSGQWRPTPNAGLEEAVRWKFERLRDVVHPEPGAHYSYEEWKAGESERKHRETYGNALLPNLKHKYSDICLERDFREKGLQVIVKLASVELTPEKPEYNGGNWHLEGMKNEHIVATAIYYYDVDNVTDSLISFRAEALIDDHSIAYEQDDHDPIATVYGTPSLRDEPAIQTFGTLHTKQGRLLAFPNTLQHRVHPFKLADPSRSGHRRFLVLWLVDPHYRITSTANVPPQQHDWIAPETIDKVLAGQDLAVELQDLITQHTDDYPMGLETAKALRLELMKERTHFMPSVERQVETYNFCEH